VHCQKAVRLFGKTGIYHRLKTKHPIAQVDI